MIYDFDGSARNSRTQMAGHIAMQTNCALSHPEIHTRGQAAPAVATIVGVASVSHSGFTTIGYVHSLKYVAGLLEAAATLTHSQCVNVDISSRPGPLFQKYLTVTSATAVPIGRVVTDAAWTPRLVHLPESRR